MSNERRSTETPQRAVAQSPHRQGRAAGFSPRGQWRKRLLISVGLVAVVALGVAVARWIPITHHFYTDADRIKVPAAVAPTRDILWQPPEKLADVINTTGNDYEPRLSADGLTLFFVRGKAGENADIYYSTRIHEGWNEPTPLADVNSEYDDLGPEPSSDGESLYFYSDRPGGSGGYDVWVAHRSRDGWQTPINLGPLVNSEFNDYGPALTPNGETLYFSSNRPQPEDTDEPDPNAWPATLREDLYHRDYDLYMAAVTERGVGAAVALAALNTPYNEGAPAVSSFGDFLYFASDRPGGEGGFDLYRSRRLRGEHRPSESLGATVNTSANELDPGLGLGGYALYFSSDRPHEPPALDSPREYDLYHTTSREVFAEAEHLQRPPIDWAGLWSRIGPNLLWALLALLLLLALLALLRDARGRRLSLLAKCLMASLVAHLLLMLLFNVWEVTASLAREFQRRGAIRIALVSPTIGDGLASQIRGPLTEVETPAPPVILSRRQSAPVEIPLAATMATLMVERGPVDIEQKSAADLTVSDADVERPLEPLPPSEPQLTTDLPLPLDPALPTEQARIASNEPDSSAHIEAMNVESLTRPPVAVATSRPIDAAAKPPMISPTHTAHEMPSDHTSVADASPVHDASPPVSANADVAQTIATLDVQRMADLALSTAPAERLPEMAEAVPRFAAKVTTASRRELKQATLSKPTAQEVLQIEPERTGLVHVESTLARHPTARATDVPSASVPSDSHQASQPDVATIALTDVLLSSLESVGVAVTAESTPQPVPDIAAPLRRRLATDMRPESASETFASLQPEATGLTPVSDSLATAPEDHAIDATVSEASFEPALRATSARAEARGSLSARALSRGSLSCLPAPADFALPSLEQWTVPLEAESSQRVASARAEARGSLSCPLRASPTLNVGHLEKPSAMEFSVSPTWHHTAGEPPSDPAEWFVRDYAIERADHLHVASVPLLEDVTIPQAPALSLELPAEQLPVANPYAQRRLPDRMTIVERMGGNRETERAVADALRWLANHQSADGRWDGDAFDEHCGACGGETDVVIDHALTGLALLCFLGAGHTHVADGPYQDTVGRALHWLLSRQKPDGDLRGNETMYTQGIVTIALSEAYGMTGDADLLEPVRLATRLIDRARNRRVGGWRYDPGQVGDTSVLGWQVMALKSASINGIAVPAGSFAAARKWLDLVSTPSRRGLYAYQLRRQYTPAMTAEGMFTQQLLGRGPDDPRMQASAEYLSQYPPDWESQPNTYYWYYATLALFQHQGEVWRAWNEALTKQLLTHQRKDGPPAGSWDPVGEWANIGGRVYQTALCTLMLEVYYRYLPLYSLEAVSDPIGTIRGLVTDAVTGEPIHGATVRLDMTDRSPGLATTTTDGAYVLSTPEVPDFFALSASMDGYVPSTANVASAMVQGTTLTLNFELQPDTEELVAIEPVPDVHHLGDDNFDGRINSRFQKKSEGGSFVARFELKPNQLPPHFNTAQVRLLAKGVQRRHKIRINGTVLDDRLDDSPDDGSFGEFSAPFDPLLLRPGTNTLEIIARPSSSDIDDFEFVNVQIHLSP
ncbi:MAG: carboxypeptidase regulatory-like domain-containing protein [Phycisphaerae bacterium]